MQRIAVLLPLGLTSGLLVGLIAGGLVLNLILGRDPNATGIFVLIVEFPGFARLSSVPSSRPHKLQSRATGEQRARVEALRRLRQPFWSEGMTATGPKECSNATSVGLSRATVARIGKSRGLSHLSAVDPRPEIIRHEKDPPGEMIHIDIKKLGRIDGIGHRISGDRTGQSNARSRKDGGKGWEYLHLAVDDHSRLAYSGIFPDETRNSCLTFLFNALRFFRSHSVKVWRVPPFSADCFAIAC